MAKIVLGVTGSVAAVKAPELRQQLIDAGHEVKLVATEAALAFFDPAAIPSSPEAPVGELLTVRGQSAIYFDSDEWPANRLFTVGEPVLHIELRKWADLLLIAPLDANTMAKLALGLCDNLLTCIYRAWDLQRPVVLAPAMNTLMWEHPTTRRHLCQLLEDFKGSEPYPHIDADGLTGAINGTCDKLRIVSPVSKKLACGDEGMGGMADLPTIVETVQASLS
jgi:phosphopantothenoylcysteine decarboxylase